MTSGPPEALQKLMRSGDREAWSTAAAVLALTDSGGGQLAEAAAAVVSQLGVDLSVAAGDDRERVAGQLAAPLLQAAAVVRGDAALWAGQSDQALLAQGRASAQGVAMFAQLGFTMMPGIADALARPGARMLDVGTGVAALAVAWATHFPALTVVGIDVLPRALELAATTVGRSTVADRVELRRQDVTELDEDGVYDLGWMPAPFLPEHSLAAGVRAVARALVPGGWLVMGHGKYGTDPLDDAISRFKTVAFGGTPVDDAAAQLLLQDAGLENVLTLPTPPGAPAVTAGRRPSTTG